MPMSDWMVGGGMATVFLSTIALVAATNISISSAPVVLWSAVDTLHKCGFIDVPDIPHVCFLQLQATCARWWAPRIITA